MLVSKMQYNVLAATPKLYKSTVLNNGNDTIIEPSLIYYNIYNGLIKVDFDDGSTWELKEIQK